MSRILIRLFRTRLPVMIALTITNVRVVAARTESLIHRSNSIREMGQDALAKSSTKNAPKTSIAGLSCFVTQLQTCARSRSKSEKTVRERMSALTMLPVPSANVRGMAEYSTANHLTMLLHVLVVSSRRSGKTKSMCSQHIGVTIILCFRIAPTSAKVKTTSVCIRLQAQSPWNSI